MTIIAADANRYDRQRNTTIQNFTRILFTDGRQHIPDPFASNNRICSNFFARLNTQRCTYSLGNGVTFEKEGVKEKLGQTFDTRLKQAGYAALIEGVSFIFWNVDHIHVFKLTEFAPLWDEGTGALRAGVRYWQIDPNKPVSAVLYEEDGYTTLIGDNSGTQFKVAKDKTSYRTIIKQSAIGSEPEVIAEENYTSLPIIPLYGSRLKQSTLVGLKEKIDAYDLVCSGFANDITDCAEIYWIVSNAGGMDDQDLARFRERLKITHIANVADSDDVKVNPYTQDIPVTARKTFLDQIRSEIYEGFGGLDVTAISASNQTATAIEAAYQPLDENADDFEFQVIDAVQNLLRLQGIEDTPIFKRNRVSNQKEVTEMVLSAAQYLDDETILSKLPFLTPDEIDVILERKDEQDQERIATLEEQTTDTPQEEEESGETLNGENENG